MVSEHADSGVREEHRDKARNNQDRGAAGNQDANRNQLADGAPHKAPDHRVRREAINSGAVNRQYCARNQTLRDTVKGLRELGDKHTHALGDDEDRHRKGETGLQDIDCPVGFTRHRLYGIDTKREQNGTKEDGHYNRRGDDVVMENVQPARQFEVFNAFLFFAQERRDFIGNPGSKLLLVTDGETAAVRHFLSRLVHHVGGNTPVQGNQYRRADNGGPHGIAEDIERDRNQPRLLEHDVPGQHDGANTGNASQQDVTNIQRQREQHRVAYPAIRITHPFDRCHHRSIGIGNRAVDAVDLRHFRHHRFKGAGQNAGPGL